MNIKSTIKRMLDDTQYVAALEKQNALLKENLQQEKMNLQKEKENQKQEKANQKLDEEAKYHKRSHSYLRPIDDMQQWLLAHYDFRYNVITYVFEYRKKPQHEANDSDSKPQHEANNFDIIDKYATNTIEVQEAGIDQQHANSVMLTLVSPTQGLHKSTFLRSLLPPELRDYYTDDFSLNQKSNAQRKIVEFAIINDDELDKENPKKMPMMKTLMQTMKPSFIGAYKKNFNRLPRSASFTGTSNKRELLTDRTGSRRFLILEPEGMIDVEGIEHQQIYAQLMDEIERGEPYFFSKSDEKEMEQHNQPYYVKNELETAITRYYHKLTEGEEGLKMSAETMLEKLRKLHVKGIENVNLRSFSRALTRLFGNPLHTQYGNLYLVSES